MSDNISAQEKQNKMQSNNDKRGYTMNRPQMNGGSLLVGNNVLNDSDEVFDDLMERHKNNVKGAKNGGHKVLQRMGTHVQRTEYQPGKSNIGRGLSHGLYLPDTDRSLFRPQSLEQETVSSYEQYKQPGMKNNISKKINVDALKKMQHVANYPPPSMHDIEYHGSCAENSNLRMPKPPSFTVPQRHANKSMFSNDSETREFTSTYVEHLCDLSNPKYINKGSSVPAGIKQIPGRVHPSQQLRNSRKYNWQRPQINTRRGGGWIAQPSRSLAGQILKIAIVLNRKSSTAADAVIVHSWFVALRTYQESNDPLPVDSSLNQSLSILNTYHSSTVGTDLVYNSIISELKDKIWAILKNADIVYGKQKILTSINDIEIPDDKSAPANLPDAEPGHPEIMNVINNFHKK